MVCGIFLKWGGLTRFDCALGSHGLMRRALSVALYHTLQRQAFGKTLIEHPMMRQVLGRMALRLEGQTAALMRLARAYDSADDPLEQALCRVLTPAAKFEVCRQGIPFVGEAMEALGGLGYCEESELPRLYREMPVNSIWEGSGNIMCLDVMRAWGRLPAVQEALEREFGEVKGQNRHFDLQWRRLSQLMRKPHEEQGRAVTSTLFNLFVAAQLLRYSSPPLAEAWCQMTLDARGERILPDRLCDMLFARAMGG
ncbi:Putative acyl-CoA dehydrogenase AidB [Serratia plymuthica]|nr:Putative acyl-CoA dehydrogenase AidB [Serratia plymuthica]